MILDAILERLGLPVKFNNSTINTRSTSIKVSMVKLCVPLNHFDISEGLRPTFKANSRLLHPHCLIVYPIKTVDTMHRLVTLKPG